MWSARCSSWTCIRPSAIDRLRIGSRAPIVMYRNESDDRLDRQALEIDLLVNPCQSTRRAE